MEFIKKIIREELQRFLDSMNEVVATAPNTFTDPKATIIYNYENGKAFAGNNLKSDIAFLDRYNLVEYLPKDETYEMWSFEFDTVNGKLIIVDIIRFMAGKNSVWTLKFGQLYRDEKHPTLIAEIENIVGYENFINTINQKLGSKLDPSRY